MIGLGVLADQTSPVRDFAAVGTLIIAVAALLVSLWALRRTRATERRTSYPKRVDLKLIWNDAPDYQQTQQLEPNLVEFEDLNNEQRARSLALEIKSRGDMGFEDMRARIRFRRPWRLRSYTTPWTAVDIPDPQQDAAGQYETYVFQRFSPTGGWSVRKVGLQLGALTKSGNGLYAPDPPFMRLVRVLSMIEDWGRSRARRRRGDDFVKIFQWAEEANPWWWRIHHVRVRLVRLLDRRHPRPLIVATVKVAWRVAQFGGEVVLLKQRHAYRLSFTQSPLMEGVPAAYEFSGYSTVGSVTKPFRYPRRLPGGKSPEGFV